VLSVYDLPVSLLFSAAFPPRFGLRFAFQGSSLTKSAMIPPLLGVCWKQYIIRNMSTLDIKLLGPPEILVDGYPVKTDRRKAIALLAYLAVTQRSHTRDHLAAFLWPDYSHDSAFAYLRRTLWELNRMLGKGWVLAEEDRICIQSRPACRLDTAAFLALNRAVPATVGALKDAVALVRGDFLEGLTVADTAPFEHWQVEQVEVFRREFSETLERLVAAHLQSGDTAPALLVARRWLALDPLNETAQRAIMRLLANMGDRSGAIRQYEACLQSLKVELGVSPQPETIQLYEAILQDRLRSDPGLSTSPLVVEAPDRSTLHLPGQLTPFIGREEEVAQIKALVADPAHRLVTLFGPGGTGKTRLSIQVASQLGELFPDGVFFVALAATPSPEAVLPALAQSLGFTFYREETPRQQLLDYLRGKNLLLVLDNLDHLLGAANLFSDILAHAPGVKLLATSRIRLNIQGEQLFSVVGMRFPEAAETETWEDPDAQARSYSALLLFRDRARRVQPAFTLTTENIGSVLQICDAVKGIPLGLELAAGWLELLPPADIVAEIHRSLDFLETSQADIPDRQRSIRAVFDSSWKLLSEDEQIVLCRLCVFIGSFSRDAAQYVGATSLRTLLSLLNKSWLQQTDAGRFQLHELLRHYGLERLQANPSEWQDSHSRYADYFMKFTVEQTERMHSSQQFSALRTLKEELPTNIKSTLDWLVSQRRWTTLTQVFAPSLLQIFAMIRPQVWELTPWIRETRLKMAVDLDAKTKEFAASAPGMTTDLQADRLAFAILSTLEIYFEESEQIKEYQPIERLVAIWHFVFEHHLVEPMGLWFAILATLAYARNIDPQASTHLDNAVDRLRSTGNRWELGIALLHQAGSLEQYDFDEKKIHEAGKIFKELGVSYEQGIVAELLGRHAIQHKQPLTVIVAYFEQAKQFFNQIGEESWGIFNYVNLPSLFFQEGRIEEGFAIHREIQRHLERVGNIRMLAASLHWEGLRATRYSTYDHASSALQRSFELATQLNIRSDYYWRLYELGDSCRVFDQPQKAIEFYEEACAGFKALNMTLALGYYERAYGDLALQAKQFTEALDHYEKFTRLAVLDNHNWSIGQSLAKCALALAYLDRRAQARQIMLKALRDISLWGEDDLALIALLAEPVCLMQEGQDERAVELAGFIANHPAVWNETRQQANAILTSLEHRLPALVIQAALERARKFSLEAVVTTLLGTPADSNES
jgi:predicted ATPase/DNA-binding SARP family transcriptional activator